MVKPHVVIISPATAKANNGNWQTARRWARFAREHYRVSVMAEWNGAACDALIALHARRSAASITALAAARPECPRALVLTGTDLYRDIHVDADAQRSLALATRIVVLQESGLLTLDPALRARASVIYQSAPALKPVRHNAGETTRRIAMIGHLRDEKDPLTFMRAVTHSTSSNARFIHIGRALDPLLEEQAVATQAAEPRYRWLGEQPHAKTRQLLKRCHLMILTSRMEGGANVIIEAVTSGVPVLASDIPGNRGLLGHDYAGYFPVADYRALARLMDKVLAEPVFYDLLRHQCSVRAALFAPEREQASVRSLIGDLIRNGHDVGGSSTDGNHAASECTM